MATPHSRYHSRLFNFVHQQSRRLTEKWENTWRHLQVATQWGLEVLLYPLYLLLHPESGAKTLPHHHPQARLHNVDAPIRNVLAVVRNLPLHSVIKSDALVWLASDLVSRHLVIITTENEILDILTRQEQTLLAARINLEVNNSHPRQLAQRERKNNLLSNIPALNRWFAPKDSASSSPLLKSIGKLIDQLFTNIESRFILPVDANKNDLTIRENIPINHGWNIRDLIREAINYFFGVGRNNQYLEPNTTESLLHNQHLPAGAWLKFSDLFGGVGMGMINKRYNSTTTIVKQSSHQSNLLVKVNEFDFEEQAVSSLGMEAQPEWIEVEATFMGYDQHILEKILSWLDRAMLWLEAIIIKLAQWLTKLRQVS